MHAQFPEISFTSTKVVLTGANQADVTGDFTLHGVTKPLVLHVTYNGGWGDMPMDAARAGGVFCDGRVQPVRVWRGLWYSGGGYDDGGE